MVQSNDCDDNDAKLNANFFPMIVRIFMSYGIAIIQWLSIQLDDSNSNFQCIDHVSNHAIDQTIIEIIFILHQKSNAIYSYFNTNIFALRSTITHQNTGQVIAL